MDAAVEAEACLNRRSIRSRRFHLRVFREASPGRACAAFFVSRAMGKRAGRWSRAPRRRRPCGPFGDRHTDDERPPAALGWYSIV